MLNVDKVLFKIKALLKNMTYGKPYGIHFCFLQDILVVTVPGSLAVMLGV